MGDGIFLSQPKYVLDFITKFHMSYGKPSSTLSQLRVKLAVDYGQSLVDATLYRQLVGSLILLLHGRPDISFDVSMLSRFMQNPH